MKYQCVHGHSNRLLRTQLDLSCRISVWSWYDELQLNLRPDWDRTDIFVPDLTNQLLLLHFLFFSQNPRMYVLLGFLPIDKRDQLLQLVFLMPTCL